MAQLVTGRAKTWPSVLLPGQRWFCFSVLLMQYQLFSDSFICLALSWAYHFLFTWYQKSQCKHLVFGHLVLEINQRQSQEAWAYFPAYGKATHLWRTQEFGPLWIKSHHPSLLRLLVPKAGWVKWLELQFLEEINPAHEEISLRTVPLTDHCPIVLAAGVI